MTIEAEPELRMQWRAPANIFWAEEPPHRSILRPEGEREALLRNPNRWALVEQNLNRLSAQAVRHNIGRYQTRGLVGVFEVATVTASYSLSSANLADNRHVTLCDVYARYFLARGDDILPNEERASPLVMTRFARRS